MAKTYLPLSGEMPSYLYQADLSLGIKNTVYPLFTVAQKMGDDQRRQRQHQCERDDNASDTGHSGSSSVQRGLFSGPIN
jgi:hypothetical protein